jgi:hypothetical protein
MEMLEMTIYITFEEAWKFTNVSLVHRLVYGITSLTSFLLIFYKLK